MKTLVHPSIPGAAWFLTFLLLSGTILQGQSAAPPTEDDFLGMVRQYADTMLEKGRGRWANPDSPLFASMLDRNTHDLVGFEYELLEEEVRPWGELPERANITGRESFFAAGLASDERMFDAANPGHDQYLFSTLYLLSETTGDPRYEDAADAALKYFLRNGQDERTGFLAWGEHLGWHLPTDRVAVVSPNGRIHELWQPVWPHYDRCYAFGETEAEVLRRFALSQARYQVRDLEKGLFNRHAFMDGEDPSRAGTEFPRLIGQMCNIWSQAYASSDDPEFRAEMIAAIENLVAGTDARRLENGVLPFGTEPKLQNMYFMQSDLIMVDGLHRAAERLPEDTASKLRAMADKTDDFLLHRLPRNPEGFLLIAHADTLEPGDPRRPEREVHGYTTFWHESGVRSNANVALHMLNRYRQTDKEGFREIAMETADGYLEVPLPGPRSRVSPGTMALAIELMLEAHELTDEPRYLERAVVFGNHARGIFFDERSPLPMVAADDRLGDVYESVTGGPDLMFALLKLHLAADPNSAGRTEG